MQRVVVRALQLVDVHTGCSGQAAVVADKHVKGLYEEKLQMSHNTSLE